MAALLLHHPAAEQAHHRQHHRVQTNGGQGQPGVNGQHRRQREAIGQQGVGQAQHRESEQAADVLHIACGAADHIAASGGLHPGGFLAQHVIKQSLPQFHLHLASDAEHQLPRQQAHTAHGARQQHNPARLAEDGFVGEAFLQFVDDPTDLHRDRDAQDVDHHQGDRSEQHGFAMRAQVAADQVQAHGRHAVLGLGRST